MLASNPIVYDLPCLLADVRQTLSTRPSLVDYPERLAAQLGTDEHEVVLVLESLKVEGEVLV